MRIVFITLMIAALSAVGVYATSGDAEVSAGFGEDMWSCIGSTTVNPQISSPVTLDWDLNESGEVTGARVAWETPDYSEYTLSVNLEASAGSL